MSDETEGPAKAERVESAQVDPDVRNALGIDDAAAAVGITTAAAKAGKLAYQHLKPEVPLTVAVIDSRSELNERIVTLSIANVSKHGVYLEAIESEDLVSFSLPTPSTVGMNVGPKKASRKLPTLLKHSSNVTVELMFEIPRSAELFERPTRIVRIGYCWLSEAKPNRVIEVPVAIRWPGSFRMP